MVDAGALKYHEITGKGGHRRIYASKFNEAGFKEYMSSKILVKMLEAWPAATMNTLEAIIQKPVNPL